MAGPTHLALVFAATAACGRIDFDLRRDGGSGDGAGDATAACTTFGPWGTPRRLTELATASNEYGGQILADNLTLYFDRHGATDEIYVAHRPDRLSPFDPPVALAELGTAASTGSATVSSDGLELYFESAPTSPVCIHRATRTSTSLPWSAPAPVTALCGSASEGAYLTHDGLTLYYNTANPPTDYEGKIMISQRASTSAAFPAGAPAGIVFAATNGYPALSGDELVIYFESGAPTDLYQATRSDLGSPWGTPTAITALNTTGIEQDVSVTPDGTEVFFASNRPGSSGLDLYTATRSCL